MLELSHVLRMTVISNTHTSLCGLGFLTKWRLAFKSKSDILCKMRGQLAVSVTEVLAVRARGLKRKALFGDKVDPCLEIQNSCIEWKQKKNVCQLSTIAILYWAHWIHTSL